MNDACSPNGHTWTAAAADWEFSDGEAHVPSESAKPTHSSAVANSAATVKRTPGAPAPLIMPTRRLRAKEGTRDNCLKGNKQRMKTMYANLQPSLRNAADTKP